VTTEVDETAVETLRGLGFGEVPTDGPRMQVGFTRDDCALFLRYPYSVHWSDENVNPDDQAHFKIIREKLRSLARWLADRVELDPDYPPMKGEARLYAASGRSQSHIWCCIYPRSVVNKSYALQVALIISAQGAEVCLCLGAGRSTLKEDRLIEAEGAFNNLQVYLASIEPDVVQALEESLPARAVRNLSTCLGRRCVSFKEWRLLSPGAG
jgi:hypothetical protein